MSMNFLFNNWWSLLTVLMFAGACLTRALLVKPARRIRERIRVSLTILCVIWGLLVAVESRHGIAQLLTGIGRKTPWWVSLPLLALLWWLAIGDLLIESVRNTDSIDEFKEINWFFVLVSVAATDAASRSINKGFAFLGAYALIAACAYAFYHLLEFISIRRPTMNRKPRS